MKKILCVFGTRPDAIKMAPLVLELRKEKGIFNIKTCITAQHRGMLDQVLSVFGIKPDYDLDIMKPDQSLFDVTSDSVRGLESILKKEKPDAVLIQGDTTTTFIAGLSAFYIKIPVGHVEAGLRTEDKYQPFPEEINRRLTSHIAEWHFAPTEWAKNNLIKEGISKSKIWVTGNTIIDALFWIMKKTQNSKLSDRSPNIGHWSPSDKTQNSNEKLILVTAHRRENFGDGIKNICHALKKITMDNKDVSIVYPVHPNPNIKKPVFEILGGVKRISLIEPLEYVSFVALMKKSYLILTDSGGIQEEAPSLGKPVLVLRNKTERPEGLKAGVVKLVGTDTDKIVNSVHELLNSKEKYDKMCMAQNPYGDGKAGRRIVEILKKVIQ